MVLALDANDASTFVNELLLRQDGTLSLREPIRAYAEAKGIPL